MASSLSCFQWRNLASDFLDGSLPSAEKKLSEAHLAECQKCTEALKHYQTILSTLRSQPQAKMTPSLKRSAFSSMLSQLEKARIHRNRWDRVPWYIRLPSEGIAVILVVLFGISSTPKIKEIYEKNIEQNINDFRESLKTSDSVDDSHPNLPAMAFSKDAGYVGAEHEEINGEADDNEPVDDKIQVGKAQLWRFIFKTVSPDDLRPQIVKTLLDLNIPQNTHGIGGIQVPGGIEFDLAVPQALVSDVKNHLEKLAPKATEFSWYKVKSKRKVPEGKSQIVIWISQPH